MSKVFFVKINVLVYLLGQTFLFIFQVYDCAFLLLENYEGLLEIGLTQTQDFLKFVLGFILDSWRLLFHQDLIFWFFFFFAFFLASISFLLLGLFFLDL